MGRHGKGALDCDGGAHGVGRRQADGRKVGGTGGEAASLGEGRGSETRLRALSWVGFPPLYTSFKVISCKGTCTPRSRLLLLQVGLPAEEPPLLHGYSSFK